MQPPRLLYAVLSLLPLATPLRAEVVDRVVAKVNGAILTLSEFQSRQIAALRDARVPPAQQEAFLHQHSRDLLDAAIDELLISQAAEEEGKDVPEDYLKQVLESIKKDYNIQSDEEFERRVREEGLTLDDIKRDVRRSILTRRYIAEQVDRKTTIPDLDVRNAYEARKGTEFTAPLSERLAEILISGKEPDAPARAAQIVARLRAGEDFAALAKTVSIAPSRSSGGDLGTVARKNMNAGLRGVVSKLEPGQVSDPIPTSGDYRILKVIAREPARERPFEEVAEQLRAELRDQRRGEAMQALTKHLREHADIEEMVREVPLQVQIDPSELQTQPSLGAAASAAEGRSAASDEEFVATQGKVRRVAPPSAEPTPAPTP
jgi:peptidyl-prolyl cis-trans isomerase SurA